MVKFALNPLYFKAQNIKQTHNRRYMSMYTLKSIAQRSTLFGAVGALVVSIILPAAPAFAAELNPLTERSLLLSSSAPGFVDTDGSGYSTTVGNPAAGGTTPGTYAPAGSGPNGKKSGETFTFKVSSDGTIKGLTFQYCTTAAGKCRGPGNNTGDAAAGPSTRESNADAWPNQRSDLNVTPGFVEGASAGQFQVTIGGVAQTGWEFAASNKEDQDHTEAKSGKNNYITLTNDTAATPTTGGTQVEVTFKASESVYITNPGADAFFVKLNTYNSEDTLDHIPGGSANIDGGVTVANVMTDSIHITTKVLETMAFSVGTRNRDTVTLNCAGYTGTPQQIADGCLGVSGGSYTHGPCDAVQNINNNRLNLGDPNAEYSLETGKAWSVYSYWRLSSNSSGGATVYYSGNTLANTVGDEIADMPTKATSNPGSEQFGLGFVAPEAGSAEFVADRTAAPTGLQDIDSFPFRTLTTQTSGKFDTSTLPAQTHTVDYGDATGTGTSDTATVPADAAFKFSKTSSTVPEPIAQQNDQVISCATAKMRYVGNIAADTPAGVYTTKINYLAAPQY